MEQKYDLKTLPVLNSMHDQIIESMELKDEKFILHYKNLHNGDGDFCSCDVIFSGVGDADVFAEIRKGKGLFVEGVGYYDTEFLEFINSNEYYIETIRYYCSYESVIILAALVSKDGAYHEDCAIRVTAKEILYRWQ